MDIGRPKRIIEVEPASVPVPESLPIPDTRPVPDPAPAIPARPAEQPKR